MPLRCTTCDSRIITSQFGNLELQSIRNGRREASRGLSKLIKEVEVHGGEVFEHREMFTAHASNSGSGALGSYPSPTCQFQQLDGTANL
jgi:hypothetical protein